MKISLTNPISMRHIRINPATNHLYLFVPVIAGQDISTDNTCKSEVELEKFFNGGAVDELESYKNTLEWHISLLKEEDALFFSKKSRLAQINIYLYALMNMKNSYKKIIHSLLSNPSNLYSIQLRPLTQDPHSKVINPVFKINRGNDDEGRSLSPLYNKMHEVFPKLIFGKPDPRTNLTTAVLAALPEKALFEDIKRTLTEKCQEIFSTPVNFKNYIKQTSGGYFETQIIDKKHIDDLMCFDEDVTTQEYVAAMLDLCAPSLWTTLPGSPFYLYRYASQKDKAESLSIITQFYLGVMNVYCSARGISDKNFGEILDRSQALSDGLVETVSIALSRGDEVESMIIAFFNANREEFEFLRDVNADDNYAIQQKFEITYRTVTATAENPHMDDFMLLDTESSCKKDIFITRDGLICTNFANLATTGQYQEYFNDLRKEADSHPDVIALKNEPVIAVDIEAEELMDKLSDVQWERLPVAVIDACRALPAFKVLPLLDSVAKGKQDESDFILQSSNDKQILLRITGRFIDYSGREFNCTAYEYAYWAKDTHMCRMLESHMDDETKKQLLTRVQTIERTGLIYKQHWKFHQNSHYDMSFALKNLNDKEFRQLQIMVGQNSIKVQNATVDNYKNISFTATEYEHLKKVLERHESWYITSFFYTSTATVISNKLQFDFHSLITALETYVNSYDKWSHSERGLGWLAVGKAQRDVPAHIAQEYCRLDRKFMPRPNFNVNQKTLPRTLVFNNGTVNFATWFPLTSISSGLGFGFALMRGWRPLAKMMLEGWWAWVCVDLEAIRHLDKVRIADLEQSLANLSSHEKSIRCRSFNYQDA